jgi:hypothetical protein
MHPGVAETAGKSNREYYPFGSLVWLTLSIVIGTADELTGQAVFAFVTLKP